ncbi:pyridoxamine 5'-phosphate oxidase family protein [Nocardia sp. NBC_00511]|uniref:pyridoxamine 5'-phosphate oxidase family protein n=1 Tax=Nocardia sp. NBC_00511 TaxID=2903591 RepID=UPI0030DFEEC4
MAATERTTGQRYPERVTRDRAAAYAILDEARVAHVGFTGVGGPLVIPTLQVRDGDRILLHGAAHGRFMEGVASGIPLCVTVTLLDGLILGRAASHHSVAYRSVMIFGSASAVEDREQRAAALERFVEGMVPGRFSGPYPARRPDDVEVDNTAVVSLPIVEFSVKTRSGFARDEHKDDGVEAWADEIPLALTPAAPIPDARTGTRFPPPTVL